MDVVFVSLRGSGPLQPNHDRGAMRSSATSAPEAASIPATTLIGLSAYLTRIIIIFNKCLINISKNLVNKFIKKKLLFFIKKLLYIKKFIIIKIYIEFNL